MSGGPTARPRANVEAIFIYETVGPLQGLFGLVGGQGLREFVTQSSNFGKGRNTSSVGAYGSCCAIVRKLRRLVGKIVFEYGAKKPCACGREPDHAPSDMQADADGHANISLSFVAGNRIAAAGKEPNGLARGRAAFQCAFAQKRGEKCAGANR